MNARRFRARSLAQLDKGLLGWWEGVFRVDGAKVLLKFGQRDLRDLRYKGTSLWYG